MSDEHKITISVALRQAKRLEEKAEEHMKRIKGANVYPKDDPPTFGFSDGVALTAECLAYAGRLRSQVAESNAVTTVPGGMSICHALRCIDQYRSLARFLKLVEAQREKSQLRWGSVPSGEYGKPDQKVQIEVRADITLAQKQDMIDQYEERVHALNDLVEESNSRTLILGLGGPTEPSA